MKAVPKPVQTFFKWVCRIFGVLILLQLLLSLVGIIVFISFGVTTHRINKTISAALLHDLVGIGVGWFLMAALGIWLARMGWRKEKGESQPGTPPGAPEPVQEPVPAAPGSALTTRNKRWSSCNILHLGADAQRLWQFDAKGGGFVLNREHDSGSLSAGSVAKSWSSLWQPKLNVAWLPPESVFLRVIELPRSSFDETLAMVELQLERLSPMPVTQVVWTMHVLPHKTGGESASGSLQTVIVVIAARGAVEEFLGKLEGRGFLADRLEFPFLDQLETDGSSRPSAASKSREGGNAAPADTWIYPLWLGNQHAALVAWWCGGTLRNLGFIALPPARDRTVELKKQLALLTWSGELEGWLATPPQWHLVVDSANAAEWENALREVLGEPLQVSPPLLPADLAARTAQRAAAASERANLLPSEFSARYHERFVDHLWLRGLGAAGALYVVGLVIYFCATGLLAMQTHKVEQAVADISGSYTNAIQLKARYEVLQERQELKYAALDCWKVIAEQLPAGISLQRLSFSNGNKLSLSGTCPADQIGLITDKEGFYDRVRRAKRNGQPMFNPNASPSEQLLIRQTGNTVTWSFGLELQHTEAGS